MNDICLINDEDEEHNQFNFRRFTQEEIIKKNNPFERTKKKEVTFPFLFQKKKVETKAITISLEDIINQVKDLSFNSPIYPLLYSPKTPPYSPYDISENIVPYLNLNESNQTTDLSNNIISNLNTNESMDIDDK